MNETNYFPAVVWQPPSPDLNLILTSPEVHIWRVALEQPISEIAKLHEFLSEDEQAKAQKFANATLKNQFIVGRGYLRHILSQYAPVVPEQLQFSTGKWGKPTLADFPTIQFNLAHSKNLAIYAVTYRREVGIDLEFLRPVSNYAAIAQRHFSKNELTQFLVKPADQRDLAFFIGWTRKEAYIKAIGQGLAFPLENFEVSLEFSSETKIVYSSKSPDEAERWSVLTFVPLENYLASVIVEGQALSYSFWQI
jgi:4'-phosphopantetheinyl transferase